MQYIWTLYLRYVRLSNTFVVNHVIWIYKSSVALRRGVLVVDLLNIMWKRAEEPLPNADKILTITHILFTIINIDKSVLQLLRELNWYKQAFE